MGETGPQIAILVFYVVPHLSSMVSSTIPAWDASVNDFGVVQDDPREPAPVYNPQGLACRGERLSARGTC